MSRPIGTTVWAQLRPKFTRRYDSSAGAYVDKVESVSLVKTTVNRPTKPEHGVLLMKLRIIVPESAFLPFVPEAVITVPENEAGEALIAVVAEDPREEEA